MKSLVLQLQNESLDSSVPILDLLRKALVIATKLNITEFQNWINLELNSYENVNEVPKYRKVPGELQAWNPYRGWIPVIIPDEKISEIVSQRNVGQPISEIENLLNNPENNSILAIPLPEKFKLNLMQAAGTDMVPSFIVNSSSLYRIIDSVRNTVLNWSLKLEKDGIIGLDMSFTEKEKEAVSTITYNIDTFIGQMTNSQLQQGSIDSNQILEVKDGIDMSELSNFIDILLKNINELSLSSDQSSELKADIQTIESQISSSKPKFSIIREGLKSIKNILQATTANVLSTELVKQLSHFIQ